MNQSRPRPGFIDRFFSVILIVKGLDGAVELIGGVLLLFVTPAQIGAFADVLTRSELSKNPDDVIATTLVHWAAGVSVSASLFAAIYLVLHGLTKVILVWAVLRDQLWAYPWMIAFLAVFIAYQSYVMVLSFSWGMLALTVFDLVMVLLTVREYRVRKAARVVPEPAIPVP